MSDWWRAVDDQLRRLGDEAPDPWADMAVAAEDAALTPEQRAFLTQLADTPTLHLENGDLERTDFDEST
jgi:hypothetical protein